MTEVVNIKNSEYNVLIDRSTKWGNPFKIVPGILHRRTVIEMYEKWITEGDGKHLLNDLHELKDKKLGCYCHPFQCHGDILVKLVNENCK